MHNGQWPEHAVTLQKLMVACLALMMTVQAAAQSAATWRTTTHDFGTFDEKEGKRSCSFVVTNTGDSALLIVGVRSSCGCTVAEHTTEPIAPGSMGTVNVTFTPTGRPGPFEKDVWVHTNSTPNRNRLTIKGVVRGSKETVSRYFPASAGEPLHFTTLTMAAGEVKKGQLRNNLTSVYNSGGDTLVITFDNNTSHIKAHASPDTIAPSGVATMTFFFDSRRTPVWGINDDEISIVARRLGQADTVAVARASIVTNVVEDFSGMSAEQLAAAPVCSVSTRHLLMRGLVAGTVAQSTIAIENTGKSDLVVRRAMPLDKAVKCKCDSTLLKPGDKATVTVMVNPDMVEGKLLNSHIEVITNDPYNPRIAVRVVAEKGDKW